MGFIDSHVHLHYPEFDPDRFDVMRRAMASGVEGFVTVGNNWESSRAAVALAAKHENVWASVGIHPHDALEVDPQALKDIESWLTMPRVVAIGEVGLDFYRDLSPRDKQIELFRHFLNLRKTVPKPFIFHCRDAYREMMQIIREEMTPPYEGIVHCFSADAEVMRRLLDFGFYISFAGHLTYKKNHALRQACAACPPERLLLETDAPYLAPEGFRGKRNEPAWMTETAKLVAELHHMEVQELGERTAANTRSVLKLC